MRFEVEGFSWLKMTGEIFNDKEQFPQICGASCTLVAEALHCSSLSTACGLEQGGQTHFSS